MRTDGIRNALTIDVEDYFHVSAFATRIDRRLWDALPGRVDRDVDAILDILDEHGARATFFVLGWVAERYPSLVRSIVARGHELASHGYWHERATLQSRAAFTQDVTRARRILEDTAGVPVKGYRAPSFSIGAGNWWALDCLEEAGYRYSSSIYPIRHDHYGMPEAPRFAFHPAAHAGLLELPVTTARLCGANFPAGGGGYFRLLPYRLSRWCLKRVNQREHQPCVFYFHPWEMDAKQPRVAGIDAKTRFRHYVNIGCMDRRIRALCADFVWDRIDRVFPGL
ncbi:MAG TPA: XrtA system polysaccharide deacetylase, partial [Burkholderiales bacterium]|nr:XrtA system polysaccharide deacetylase [Burkholderiales bacterium]